MEGNVLEVNNLVKEFGQARVVDKVSFVVPRGKVIGLLGPNGAGKTTTIHMLLGITAFTSGRIKYFGRDFPRHREYCLQRINFTSSFNSLLGRISVWENLLVFSGLYNVKDPDRKIAELVEYFDAGDLLKQKYHDLSAGQRSRVNIMKSLLNDPELILMDEPTASLDPDVADKTLSLIEELKRKRQISLLYTSHNMEEISRICDEVIFLSHGRIVAQDTPLNLTKRITNAEVRLVFLEKKAEFENYLKEKKYRYQFTSDNIVRVRTEEKLIPKLIFGASKAGVYITDIEVEKPSLEDVFLQIAREEDNVVV